MAVSKTLVVVFALVAVAAVARESPEDERQIVFGAVPYAATPRYYAPGYLAAANPPPAAGYIASAYAPPTAAYIASAYAAPVTGYVSSDYAAPNVDYVSPRLTFRYDTPPVVVAPQTYLGPTHDDGKYFPGKYERITVPINVRASA